MVLFFGTILHNCHKIVVNICVVEVLWIHLALHIHTMCITDFNIRFLIFIEYFRFSLTGCSLFISDVFKTLSDLDNVIQKKVSVTSENWQNWHDFIEGLFVPETGQRASIIYFFPQTKTHFCHFHDLSQLIFFFHFLSLVLLSSFCLSSYSEKVTLIIPNLGFLSSWICLSSLNLCLCLSVGISVESCSSGTGENATCDSGSVENPDRNWAAVSHRPVEESVPALQGQGKYG